MPAGGRNFHGRRPAASASEAQREATGQRAANVFRCSLLGPQPAPKVSPARSRARASCLLQRRAAAARCGGVARGAARAHRLGLLRILRAENFCLSTFDIDHSMQLEGLLGLLSCGGTGQNCHEFSGGELEHLVSDGHYLNSDLDSRDGLRALRTWVAATLARLAEILRSAKIGHLAEQRREGFWAALDFWCCTMKQWLEAGLLRPGVFMTIWQAHPDSCLLASLPSLRSSAYAGAPTCTGQ